MGHSNVWPPIRLQSLDQECFMMHIQKVTSNSFEHFLGQKSPHTDPLGHWKIVKLVSKRDLLLIFQNAMMYNSSKTDIYRMALEMERDVNQQVTNHFHPFLCPGPLIPYSWYSKVADFIGTQMMVEIDAWIKMPFLGSYRYYVRVRSTVRYRRKNSTDSFIR